MNFHLNKTPITAALICALVLHGCSMFGDREPDYLSGQEGKTLDVPEGLDKPREVNAVVIGVDRVRLPEGEELNFLPPRAAVTQGGGEANAYIAWSAAGAYLAVKDSPASVLRRLRFAIRNSGMDLIEVNDEAGHLFRYVHTVIPVEKGFFDRVFFWRDVDAPNHSGTFRVDVQGEGEEARVWLVYENGSRVPSNTAEHILGIFMERLG